MLKTDNTLLERLNRLIDDNLDNPTFTIDTICQALGTSRSHLHRTVKESTENSTSHYIRKRRLLRAKALLTGSDLRIAEICDAVGINNPQNFSTYFTEEFHISPTQFRKQYVRTIPPEPDLKKEVPLYDALLPTKPENLPENPLVPFLGFPQRPWIYASFAAILLVVVGTCSYFVLKLRSEQPASPPVSSLAVLPFVNLGNAEGNPACASIMDNIYTSVAHLDNLKVIARASSDKYKNTQKGVLQIGEALRVAYVLKGDFLKTGDQVQIKINIIGTQDGAPTWTKKYSGHYNDLFQLTDQIVADVARQLKLTTAVGKVLAHTQNIEAYNDFLQGRQLLVSRLVPDLRASLSRFDQALALDSTFAEAWAQKAVAYHLLLGSGEMDTPTLNRLTEANALQAIRLDPTSSTAYGVLGSLYYSTYQWQASENAFRIALQHNPNDAQVNHWYALLLRTTGRIDEAVHYSTQAITLDPLHPIFLSVYISNCSLAHRFDLARAGIKTGQGLFDRSFAYQMSLAYYWLCQSNYGRAAADFRQAIVLNPDDRGQVPILVYCEAKRGNRQQARLFIRELTATTARSDYERAVVYAGLEQADSSMHYLKKAAEGGYFYRDTKVMPVFRPYHKTLAFRAVLRRYNLAD